ncbi:unnamed protein product, partial [Candidula unifasciata]
CPVGWFGSRCKYKCRCVNDTCSNNGQCISPYTCQGGWFGPECQYGNTSVLTDGNDNTCAAASAPATVTIMTGKPLAFTWLRLRVRNPDLSLTFLNSTEVNCANLKKVYVDSTTMDIHCNITQLIMNVTINGAAVTSLCSVYISGGRNVALKERAAQDTTFSEQLNGVQFNYTADLAVDGNNRQSLTRDKTCSHSSGTQTWTLTLSQPRLVHRYKLYNRGDGKYVIY